MRRLRAFDDDGIRERLVRAEAQVRSLQAQLRGARAERDALRISLRRLESEQDAEAWKD